MADKPSGMTWQAVSYHSEARASEEVGSLSAPRAALSRPIRVALKIYFRSDRSIQFFIKKWRHDNHNVITP